MGIIATWTFCRANEAASLFVLDNPHLVTMTSFRADVDRVIGEARRRAVGPCPCECNRGGFCGGCGHAGCGGR